jgi:hypothetical protein
LNTELAKALFINYAGKWYGPPVLLRRPLSKADDSAIIDGRIRLRAMRELCLRCDVPNHIFPEGVKRNSEGVLLARALALAGHYERAWAEVPLIFRHCIGDVKAYAQVPTTVALQVYRAGHRSHAERAPNAGTELRRAISAAFESGEVPDRDLLEQIMQRATPGTMVARMCFMVTDDLLEVLRQHPNMSRAIRAAVLQHPDAPPFKWKGGARNCITARLQQDAWDLISQHEDASAYVESCCRAAYQLSNPIR